MTISEEMKPHFRLAGWLALVLVAFDTWLSIKFGWSVSLEMAGVYGAISLASGTFLIIAVWFYLQGGWFKHLAKGLGVVWCFAFVFNIWSNMGVATANRMADVQTANVKQVNWDGQRKSADEATANVALWSKMIADMQAQAPWAPTVKADALREEIKTLQGRLKDETAGKRGRNSGCGKECERLQNAITDATNRLGTAEKFDDLTKKIEAAKATLSKAREELKTTDKGISHASNQAALYAKVVNVFWGGSFSTDPTQAQVAAANEGTGIATAFVLALLAAAVSFVYAMPALFGTTSAKTAALTLVKGGAAAPVGPHVPTDNIADRFASRFGPKVA